MVVKFWWFKYTLSWITRSPAIQKLSSKFWNLLLLLRYNTRVSIGQFGGKVADSPSFGFESLPIVVINLAEREDRWRQVVAEMSRLGAYKQVVRFDAIKNSRGMIGCSLSHARALEDSKLATTRGGVLVCEDDIEFIASRDKIYEVITAFLSNRSLDVLLLAYNSPSTPRRITENLSITCDSGTTSCYLVKDHAREILIASFEKSARLLGSGYPDSMAAPDQLWKSVQKSKLVFAVPAFRLAKQRASFSDIEHRFVDYGV